MVQLITCLAMVVSALFPQQETRVSVTVQGLEQGKGAVYLYLYTSDDGFPTDFDKAVRTLSAQARGTEATAVFDNVPAGTYAIAVYHDENGNGEMDTNFLGIPSEGVGVSNNAKGFFGPPSFSDAKFAVGASPVALTITMKY